MDGGEVRMSALRDRVMFALIWRHETCGVPEWNAYWEGMADAAIAAMREPEPPAAPPPYRRRRSDEVTGIITGGAE